MAIVKFHTTSLKRFLNDLMKTRWFDNDPKLGPPLPGQLEPGEGKLVVVTGENASGKSFYRRLVHVACQTTKTECIHTSQEDRSREGMHRIFKYGAEDWESTGYISAKSVNGAIKTSQGRDNRHVLFLDEPDIGLSDNYAAGMGQKICEFLKDSPEKLFAIFIVTHRKALVSELAKIKPWHMRFGTYVPLSEWLISPVTPNSLEDLLDSGITRFRRLSKILETLKK